MTNQLGLQIGTTDGLQFAVVAFNGQPIVGCYLNQVHSMADFTSCVNRLAYIPGLTDTGDALKLVDESVLTTQRGDRSTNPNLVILVTDGVITPGTPDPVPFAQSIRSRAAPNNGIIFGVGVTGLNGNNAGAFYDELFNITGNSRFIFNVTNYANLPAIAQTLINTLGCKKQCYADISFIIETTELVGESGFAWEKTALTNLVNQFSWNPLTYSYSYNYTMGTNYPGLAHFSSPPGSTNYAQKSSVDMYPAPWSKAQFLSTLNHENYGYNGVTGGQCDLDLAMQFGIQMFNGAVYRNQTPDYRFIILMAQGFYDAGTNPVANANRLRNSYNASIFAIAMPPRINTGNLQAIVGGDSTRVYTQSTYMQIPTRINTFLQNAGCQPFPPVCYQCCNQTVITTTTSAPTTTPMHTPPPITANCTLDVILVLDRSESITEKNWTTIKNWASSFARQVSSGRGVGPYGMQFAVVTYATTPTLNFNLGQYNDINSVVNAIQAIQYQPGLTDTGSALQMALNQVIGSAGDRDNTRYPNSLVLVTDGRPTEGSLDPVPVAQGIRNTGTQTIAVGVTGLNSQPGIFYDELVQIAGANSRVFNVSSYSNLYNIIGGLIQEFNCTNHCYADIAFCVESTELIGRTGWAFIQSAVLNISRQLPLGTDQDYTGFVRWSNTAKTRTVFDIRNWNYAQEASFVTNSRWVYQYIGGQTNLAFGLQACSDLLSRATPRPQIPDYRFVVLFAEGFHDQGDDPYTIASRIRNDQGATILAVAMPPRTLQPVLNQITSGSSSITTNVYQQANAYLIGSRINQILMTRTCGQAPVASTTTTTTTAVPPVTRNGTCGPCPTTTCAPCPMTCPTLTPQTTTPRYSTITFPPIFTTPSTGPNCYPDVLFVLDKSESVTEANWTSVKSFAVDTMEQLSRKYNLAVGLSGLRFAVIDFNTNASVVFYFSQSTSLAVAESYLNSDIYFPGLTNLGGALQLAYDAVLVNRTGDRQGTFYPDVLILVTDGFYTPGTADPVPIARKLRTDKHASIFAVGVGGRNGVLPPIDYNVLEAITGNPSFIFNTTYYSQLPDLVENLIDNLQCTHRCYADIVVLIETTELVGKDLFQWEQAAVMQMVSQLRLGRGFDYVGFIHFSQFNRSAISLNISDWDYNQVNQSVYSLPWGFNGITGITNLGLGLQLADQAFANHLIRDQSPDYRYLIFLGSGFSDQGLDPNHPYDNPYSNQVYQYADDIRNKYGAQIIAVQVGPRTNYSSLLRMTNNASNIYTMNNYQQISPRVENYLSNAQCGFLPTAFCQRPRDIVFVLHQTMQQGTHGSAFNFAQMRKFFVDLVNLFSVDNGAVRIGMVAFAHSVNTYWRLDRYSTSAQLKQAIMNIQYPGNNSALAAGSNLGQALNVANQYVFQTTGDRPLPEFPNIAIVLTDTFFDNNPGTLDPVAAANRIRASNSLVYVVGVGENINTTVLSLVAGGLHNTIHSYAYEGLDLFANDYFYFKEVNQVVCNEFAPTPGPPVPTNCVITCYNITTPGPSTSPAPRPCIWDLAILIDSTSQMTGPGFQSVTNYLAYHLFPIWNMQSSGMRAVIGNFDFTPNFLSTLSTYNSLSAYQSALAQLNADYSGTGTISNLGTALQQMLNFFTLGDRSSIPNVVIVFTAANPSNVQAAQAQANVIKQRGFTVIIVYMGTSLSTARNLRALATTGTPYFAQISDPIVAFDVLSTELLLALNCGNAKEAMKGDDPYIAPESHPVFDPADTAVAQNVRASGCPPGYTGQYCQLALCYQMGSVPSLGNSTYGPLISVMNLQTCSAQNQLVLVDSHVTSLILMVDGNSGTNPVLRLSDTNGNIVTPSASSPSSAQVTNTYNGIAPGRYFATFSASGTTGCFFAVYSGPGSQLAILGGFVSGSAAVHNDKPSPVLTEHVPSYFVAHADGLPCPGKIAYLQVFAQFQLIWSSPAQTRYNCAYETYFGLINCDSTQNYHYKMYGIDEKGFAFERTDNLNCVKGSLSTTTNPVTVTQPATVTTPTPGTCLNGGTFVANQCYCPKYFSGQFCQTWVCVNGGTTVGSSCSCTQGYNGAHCEIITCNPVPPYNFNISPITLSFVVLNRYTMTTDWPEIESAAVQIINAAQVQHPGWIQNYVLTTFSDFGVSTTTYNSSAAFLRALNNPQFELLGNCNTRTLTAILQTVFKERLPYSPMYIFTDGAAIDYTSMNLIMNANQLAQNKLYFVITDPRNIAPNCPLQTTGPAYQVYWDLAQATGGQLFRLNKQSVGSFLTNFFPTQYNLDTLLLGDYLNCASQPAYTTFQVDSTISAISISMTASMNNTPTLQWTDPNGNQHRGGAMFQIGNMAYWQIHQPSVGIYSITLGTSSGTGPCSIRVRAVTPMKMIYSYSSGVLTDASKAMASYNTQAFPVVHMTNLTRTQAYAEAMIYTSPGNYLYISSGTYRAQCQFQISFNGFTCKTQNQVFYSTVYGRDQQGFTFQRTTVGFCAFNPATPTPPSICQNGGVFYNNICVCPPYWTGNRCQTIVCGNGGTSLGTKCACPAGYTGPHCLTATCSSKNPNVETSPDGRSLALVIQTTTNTSQDITQIKQSASYLVSQMIQQDRNWISKWVLVTFTDLSAQTVTSTTDSNQFLTAINSLNPLTATSCQKKIGQATSLALQNSLNYSMVYVFTDSTPSDYAEYTSTVYNLLESTKTSVSYMLSSYQPCGVNTQTAINNFMLPVSQLSDGELYFIEKATVGLVMRYIPTRYQSGLAAYGGGLDCSSNPQIIYFPVDSHAYSFTAAAGGYNVSLTLHAPNGSIYNPAPIVSGSNSLYIAHAYKRSGTVSHGFGPGIWTAVMQTSPIPGTTSACGFQIRIQSTLQLYYGFTQNIHNDFPKKEPSAGQNQYNYMVGHVSGLPASGTLEYAQFHNLVSNYTFAGALTMKRRSGCGFEFYSSPFLCNAPAFLMAASGYDEQNYLYTRLRIAVCLSNNNNCLHGVVVNGTCYCQKYWYGQTCDLPMCLNGGTAMVGTCNCAPGYTGTHCEIATCTRKSPGNFGFGQKSFAIVLDGSLAMSFTYRQLRTSLGPWLRSTVQQHPNEYNNFILVPYYDTGNNQTIVQRIINSHDINSFLTAIQNVTMSGGGVDCPNPVLFGLESALSIMNPGSPVYVFTSATAKYPSMQSAVLNLIALKRAKVNFVMFDTNPCGSSWVTQGATAILNVINASGGSLFYGLQPPQVQQSLPVLATQYESGLVHDILSLNCSGGLTVYTPVSSHATMLSILASGTTPSMTLVDPNGNIYTGATTVYSNTVQTLIEINSPIPGTWRFITVAAAACRVQVRETGNMQMFYGFSKSAHTDNPSPVAYGGSSSSACNYDIAFVLDRSESVTELNWPLVQSFVIATVNQISASTGKQVGLSGLRVAIIAFNSQAQIVCNLTQSTSMTALQNCVNSAIYSPGLTFTAQALNAAQTVFQASNGDRQSVPNLLFLVTDGMNTPGTPDPIVAAGQLRAAGVTIYGVGTSQSQAFTNFLSQITGTSRNVFTVNSYSALSSLTGPIIAAINCTSSGSVTTNYMLLHMSNLAANGSVYSVNMYSRVGQMDRAALFSRRSSSSCSFDWVSQPFTCPAPYFAVVVSGLDGQGYPFQRIGLSQCFGTSQPEWGLDQQNPHIK
jgi:uncharacterized protein YegL